MAAAPKPGPLLRITGYVSESAIVGPWAGRYGPTMKASGWKEEQFVTDATGKRVGVLLGVRTYERLREAEEDLADIRAYDAMRAKIQAELSAGQAISLADYRSQRNTRRK